MAQKSYKPPELDYASSVTFAVSRGTMRCAAGLMCLSAAGIIGHFYYFDFSQSHLADLVFTGVPHALAAVGALLLTSRGGKNRTVPVVVGIWLMRAVFVGAGLLSVAVRLPGPASLVPLCEAVRIPCAVASLVATPVVCGRVAAVAFRSTTLQFAAEAIVLGSFISAQSLWFFCLMKQFINAVLISDPLTGVGNLRWSLSYLVEVLRALYVKETSERVVLSWGYFVVVSPPFLHIWAEAFYFATAVRILRTVRNRRSSF